MCGVLSHQYDAVVWWEAHASSEVSGGVSHSCGYGKVSAMAIGEVNGCPAVAKFPRYCPVPVVRLPAGDAEVPSKFGSPWCAVVGVMSGSGKSCPVPCPEYPECCESGKKVGVGVIAVAGSA